jgi:hypothetical protein
MPIDRDKMRKFDALLDSYLAMRAKYPDDEDEELAEGNTLPVPQQFPDSPPEMPKESLWGGKPPIPISHL